MHSYAHLDIYLYIEFVIEHL